MAYKFFDKNSEDSDVNMQAEPVQRMYANDEKLAEEWQKPIIRKFSRRTIYSGFKDNNSGADLADMQLISKFNKGFRFLLCVIDIFSKYVWVVLLIEKNLLQLLMLFRKF